jgi:hypothetical protein
MIAIIALLVIAIWLAIVIFLCRRLPVWLNVKRNANLISFLLFPVLFVLPIADDLIGRWQFYQLCEREAVVTTSPGWEAVKRAKRLQGNIEQIKGRLIPITSIRSNFVDIDTQAVFMSTRSFHTSGGVLKRYIYGLGGSTSCHAFDESKKFELVNIEQLIKQGEMK